MKFADFMLISNNKELVEAGLEALTYKTIINDIPKSPVKYILNNSNIAIIDSKLAKGKKGVGIASNYAQRFLSLMWDAKNKEEDKELIEILENEVAIFSVLAQVAIDNAKRKFDIELNSEINSHSKGIKGTNKPTFWKYTENKKTKEQNEIAKLRKTFGKNLSEAKLKQMKKDSDEATNKAILKEILINENSNVLNKEARDEIRAISNKAISKLLYEEIKADVSNIAVTSEMLKERVIKILVGENLSKKESAIRTKVIKKQLAIIEKLIEDSKYNNTDTPMNWIQEEVDGIKNASRGANVKVIDISECLKLNKRDKLTDEQLKQLEIVEKSLNDFRDKEKNIKTNSDAITTEDKKEENIIIKTEYEDLMDELSKLKIGVGGVRHLVEVALTSEESNTITKNRSKILKFCYDYRKNAFLNCFKA